MGKIKTTGAYEKNRDDRDIWKKDDVYICKKKLPVRNIGKNRNHRNIWENTTGIYEKNKDDRNI
jgi:hypothetical protein